MEDIKNKESVPIQVQFEYLNDENSSVLSKEYKVTISLEDNTEFEENKQKILKNCNFKTQQERNNYHMFDQSKKRFLTKNEDFIPYIKTKSPVILINCYTYAGKIIEKVKEESERHNMLGENNQMMEELKKKEMTLVLSSLENNLQVDMFADEFIFKNGIEYLVSIIKDNSGDIRMYSLEGLNKLLSFESAYEIFDKKDDFLSKLFDSFIISNEINCAYSFFDIIIKLIGGKEDKTMNLIERMNDNFFDRIINYLSEDNKEDNIKSHTLLFINMILNFSSASKHLELLFKLYEKGIFDKLDNIIKIKEIDFLEQLDLFETSVKKILNESDKNDENYNNINEKFNSFIENRKLYHIQHLIKSTKDEDETIRENAKDELNNLLKEADKMNTFYESFMKNENMDIINSFYDYLISLLESNQNKLIDFINAAKKYSEKTNTKIFAKIIDNVSQDNNKELKNHTLNFMTKLITISQDEKKLEILFFFTDSGIFDILAKLRKYEEPAFLEHLAQFRNAIGETLEKGNKEDENYNIIKSKYQKYLDDKLYHDIKDLILVIHNNIGKPKEQSKYFDELKKMINTKESFIIFFNAFMDNKDENIDFTYFDAFVQIFNEEKIEQFIEIYEDYANKNNILKYNKIFKYFQKDFGNNLIKNQALQVFNMIISFSKPSKQYSLLVEFMEMGVFDLLDEMIKISDKLIEGQLKLFLGFVKNILKQSDKNDQNYKNLLNKYKTLEDDKKFYDKTLDDFVVM